MAAPSTVAVIDIGSNSIKVLVAHRGPHGQPQALATQTLDARISAGISQREPRLSDEGMARGVAAIQQLLATAAPHQPAQTILVATSAVRDARNGADFRERVRAATGHTIRILTGDEEAQLIGRGLTVDPALRHLQNFYVFDLGGGSLECLAFERRQRIQALSLPLGCVRLTERFVNDPAAPVSVAERQAIRDHTRATVAASGFRFTLPAAEVVFTGGTMTTARIILGGGAADTLTTTSPRVPTAALADLLERTANLPLPQRKTVPGLPPARADVFPTALVVTQEIAALAHADHFLHSLYNLRWGLAAEALAAG